MADRCILEYTAAHFMGGTFTYINTICITTCWVNEVRSFCECKLYFLSSISREFVTARKQPHGSVVVRVARGANCTAVYSTWTWWATPTAIPINYKSTTHRGTTMEFVSNDEGRCLLISFAYGASTD